MRSDDRLVNLSSAVLKLRAALSAFGVGDVEIRLQPGESERLEMELLSYKSFVDTVDLQRRAAGDFEFLGMPFRAARAASAPFTPAELEDLHG